MGVTGDQVTMSPTDGRSSGGGGASDRPVTPIATAYHCQFVEERLQRQ